MQIFLRQDPIARSNSQKTWVWIGGYKGHRCTELANSNKPKSTERVHWILQFLLLILEELLNHSMTITWIRQERDWMEVGKRTTEGIQQTQGVNPQWAMFSTCLFGQNIQNGNRCISLCIWSCPIPETRWWKVSSSWIHFKINAPSWKELQCIW